MRAVLFALLLWPKALLALESGGVLADPALGARSCDISDGQRRLKEAIDKPQAELARIVATENA